MPKTNEPNQTTGSDQTSEKPQQDIVTGPQFEYIQNSQNEVWISKYLGGKDDSKK